MILQVSLIGNIYKSSFMHYETSLFARKYTERSKNILGNVNGLEGKYVQHWDLKYSWILFLLQDFKCEQQCDCNSRDFQAHLKHKCYCLGLSLVTLYSINFKQLSELRQKGLVPHCGTVHTVLSGSGYLFESTLNMLQTHKESGYFCLILE